MSMTLLQQWWRDHPEYDAKNAQQKTYGLSVVPIASPTVVPKLATTKIDPEADFLLTDIEMQFITTDNATYGPDPGPMNLKFQNFSQSRALMNIPLDAIGVVMQADSNPYIGQLPYPELIKAGGLFGVYVTRPAGHDTVRIYFALTGFELW